MGGKQPEKLPPPPQKTVKEMVKEFTKSINKLRREFQREVNKLEFNNKKVRNDLERMSSMRLIAQNLIKNNQYIRKYNRLDAQLADVVFQLNATATTETLVSVMSQMGTMMKKANSNVDVKNIHVALEQFNMEVEKQNMVGEQIQDLMDDGDLDQDNDEDADKLIFEIEGKVGGGGDGGNKIVEKPNNFESLEQQIQNLK